MYRLQRTDFVIECGCHALHIALGFRYLRVLRTVVTLTEQWGNCRVLSGSSLKALGTNLNKSFTIMQWK